MANPRCTTTTPLEGARAFQDEGTEVSSYIETADAGVYTKVCYYPVAGGPRPVECVPPVEFGPKTELDLKASLEISTEVWLDPVDLSGSDQPRIENASSIRTPDKLEPFFRWFYVDWSTALKVWRDPTRYSRVHCLRGGASCDSGQPQIPKECGVLRPTNSPTYVVGTPKTEVLDGIVLRLSPKTAAEVCYNPPSHSLSETAWPTTAGTRSSP